MRASHPKSYSLHGFDNSTSLTASKLTARRGVSGIAAVLIVAGIFVASVGFLSWKFKPAPASGSSQGFFSRTSALISKTFGGMFSLEQGKPVVEIDLGEPAASGAVGGNKNSVTATAADTVSNSRLSNSRPRAEKKSIEKISENKSSFSPAEIPIVQSNTDGNNFSASSSADSELPAAANSKTSESPSSALCDFKKLQIPNHKILFSEIAWMGSGKSASDEWIELKNNSGRDMPLAGWQVLSNDENIKIIFEEKNNFPAGALYLLERSDDNSAPNVPADKMYTGALSNDGARLGIFNANCELADEIDASKSWPAGDNAEKKTMERSSLDLSWHMSSNAGGTPKAENSAAFLTGQDSVISTGSSQPVNISSASQNATTSSNTANNTASVASDNNSQASTSASVSHIFISDIQTTGGSGKSDNDFIKAYNAGDSAVDIGGWQLKKRTQSGTESSVKVFPSGANIASRGYFVWANSEDNFAGSIGANVSSTSYLSNNYSVALFDSSGKIVDAVAWGSGHTNPFVEGSAYPTNPAANQTLSRKSSSQDTDNNAADFEIR